MAQILQGNHCIRFLEKRDILFWKIERRFDALRELALQGAQGATRGFGSRGVYQISHAFRLCEVEFIVEKCTLGEFAGLGDARAEIKTASEQQLQHHGTAAAL